MANRILRDWTQSENVNAISEGSEVFFTRLIMKADDYGCFYGNFKLLKSALYPLREITNFQIEQFLRECEENNLLIRYVIENKQYVRINNFGQRLRTMNNRFPLPDDRTLPTIVSNPLPDDRTLPTIVSNPLPDDRTLPPETKRNEVETKRNETEYESHKKSFYDELLNSKAFETIARNNNLTTEKLKLLIPEFKKKENLEYQSFKEFANHFKNCVPKLLISTSEKPFKPKNTFN